MAMATQHERSSKILSIEDIGNLVGARQIIYVQMEQFQNSADGFTPRPIAACTVRVIDLDKRERVYPPADSPSGSRIVHVHAKDTRIDADKLYDVGILGMGWHTAKLPGLGDVHWGQFFSALSDTGYRGAVCIEVEDRAYEGSLEDRKRALRQSKRFLQQFMA